MLLKQPEKDRRKLPITYQRKKFFSALKDVSERIGGSATFKFKLPHEGAPTEWIHNGKRIYPEKEPHKYDVISDGLTRTLIIKNLKVEEQGNVGIRVANKVTTAKLRVQGLYFSSHHALMNLPEK